MILLLLTSALALSFVPLKSNALTEITVQVGTVAYDAATKKLTIPLTASAALASEENSFELAIFEAATGTDMIGDKVSVKALLTDTSEQNAEFTLNFATIKADLAAVHIDVIETDKDDDTSTRSMLTARKEVAFRTVSAVAFAEDTDPTKVKITVTVDEVVTDATLEFLGESLETTSTVAKEYSAVIEKANILAAESLVGYFKGADLAKSSLPFTILIAKPVAPEFKLLSATHVQFDYTPTGDNKLMILPEGGEEKEITKPQGETYYTVAYADIGDEYKLYYAQDAGAPMSAAHAGIALDALTAPTTAWEVDTGEAKLPKLKVTFADAGTNRQLVIKKPAETFVGLDTAVTDLTPADIEGTDAYFVVADSTTKVPTSVAVALAPATITATKGDVADAKIPVTVTMTPGTYAKQPKGIVVYSKGETLKANAKYYALAWSDDAANTATYEVPEAELPASTDKDVECYVSEDCSTMPEIADIVKLSAKLVLRKATLPTVTVGDFDFVPAGLKLTVPLKSSANLTADAGINYAVAIYATAEGGDAPLGGADIKALLDGTDKTIVVELDSAVYAGQKSLYVDIVQAEEGQAPVSIIAGEARKEATFAAKATGVTVAKDTDATKLLITFTLSDELAGHATAKFVLNGEHDVVKLDSPANTYTVTMLATVLHAAPTTMGYFKGADMAKTTLPIVLFASNPDIVLEHVDATNVYAKPATAVETKKVWFKSGDADPAELTVVTGKTYYEIEYAKLSGVAFIYYTDATGLIVSNKQNLTLPAFTAPEYEWVLVTEGDDKTPKVKLVFEGANAKRKLIVPGTPDTVISLDTAVNTFDLADLVQTGAYYIVYDTTSKVPETRPLAIPAATLVQAKTTEKDGKVPVTVTVEAGLLTAVPTGILVHAEGETVADKMKYYALSWGTTAETVNKATAQVTVADFAELTAKNIESYVANKVGEAAPTKIAAAEKIVVIPKKEDPGKDEGAFGQMVSLMAVVVSLFVLAL